MRPRSDGFTLLEALVAVIVFGFIMIGLDRGVRFGLAAWTAQTRIATRIEGVLAMDALFRQLIEQMIPAAQDEPPALQGDAREIALQTVLPNASSTDGVNVGLPVAARLGLDGRHQLLLRYAPHPRAARIADQPSGEAALLGGIDRIALSYYGATRDGEPASWREAWSAKAPPALIRLRIVFAPGDPRRWPDFVAAPVREPVGR